MEAGVGMVHVRLCARTARAFALRFLRGVCIVLDPRLSLILIFLSLFRVRGRTAETPA